MDCQNENAVHGTEYWIVLMKIQPMGLNFWIVMDKNGVHETEFWIIVMRLQSVGLNFWIDF